MPYSYISISLASIRAWIDPTSKKEGHCDITARTVLLYVLFCLTYMYCTLYILYILYTVHTVHVPCFPVPDVEVSSSTSVHTLVHTYKFTCVFTYHLCSHRIHLNKAIVIRLVISVCFSSSGSQHTSSGIAFDFNGSYEPETILLADKHLAIQDIRPICCKHNWFAELVQSGRMHITSCWNYLRFYKRSAVVDCSSVGMGEGYIHSTRL